MSTYRTKQIVLFFTTWYSHVVSGYCGVSYRHGECVVGMVQLHWGKIKVGYAYDYGIGAISKTANGSHDS